MKKVLQSAFLLGLLLFLTLSLAKTVFFPKEINTYENRYAEKIAAFSLQGFFDGSFQESVDAALSDQVLLSQTFKQNYNICSSNFIKTVSQSILKASPMKYIALGDKLLFGGEHIMYPPRTLESQTDALDARAANYNSVFSNYPDVDFKLFFIEKDTDINFETGYRTEAFQYLMSKLHLPAENAACFEIGSFEQYRELFYRTDHHWNAAGSLKGYRQVMALLKPGESTLMPTATATPHGSFAGSKATGSFTSYSEEISVYLYDFPELTVTVNGEPADGYGDLQDYLSGEHDTFTYASLYGYDHGEITFDSGTTGRGNLLIIGESFDNAILNLLASHYDRTYSIDLRYYEPQLGHAFDLDSYLNQHEIDTVLLIGNIDYFILDDFMLGGASDGIQ